MRTEAKYDESVLICFSSWIFEKEVRGNKELSPVLEVRKEEEEGRSEARRFFLQIRVFLFPRQSLRCLVKFFLCNKRKYISPAVHLLQKEKGAHRLQALAKRAH